MRYTAPALFAAVSLLSGVRAGTYGLSDNWVGSAFLSAFEWQAIADPTHGRVLVFVPFRISSS